MQKVQCTVVQLATESENKNRGWGKSRIEGSSYGALNSTLWKKDKCSESRIVSEGVGLGGGWAGRKLLSFSRLMVYFRCPSGENYGTRQMDDKKLLHFPVICIHTLSFYLGSTFS